MSTVSSHTSAGEIGLEVELACLDTVFHYHSYARHIFGFHNFNELIVD